MVSVLLTALAGMGAADHLVTVATALQARGHRVSVATGGDVLDRFRHLDVELHSVPEPPMPELLQSLPPVLQRAQQLLRRVRRNVIDPLPEQAAVVRDVIRSAGVQVVITDPLFLGASMMGVLPREARPAIIALGFFAPWIPDPQVPPYGLGVSPAEHSANRIRSIVFELLTASAFVPLSRSFNAAIAETFGVHRRGDLRASTGYAEVWAQLTVPRFEYPRSTLPANFRFIGPLHPRPDLTLPDWWNPEEEAPFVLVRSHDTDSAVRDLVLPTIDAFADSDDTVVVVGAARTTVAAAYGGPLPGNVRFEAEAPWPRLDARHWVAVSDGDYLHTQHALRFGIPVVVAGTLETDVETAARVTWSGAGVDLRTRRPEPAALRAAVTQIRENPTYRFSAAKIAAQIAATDAETELCGLVEHHGAH